MHVDLELLLQLVQVLPLLAPAPHPAGGGGGLVEEGGVRLEHKKGLDLRRLLTTDCSCSDRLRILWSATVRKAIGQCTTQLEFF